MMAPRLGTRQRSGSRPLALFAAQLGVLGTTAAPTDATLAFLYPALLEQDKPRRRRRSQRSESPVASSSSLPPIVRAASSAGSEDPVTTLPDIYAPGADGLWRKTSGVAETCTMQPTSVSSSAQTTALEGATSAASLEEFDTSTLPDGWKLQEPLARSSLIVIICLSVAVACAFVVLVLSLVSWRRRVHQDRDLERRRRKAKDIPPDDSLVVAAATQRKWLRAGMRWKENVRLSARRRRSTRAASSANDSVGSLRLSDIVRTQRLSSSSINLSSRPSSPSHHPQSSSSSAISLSSSAPETEAQDPPSHLTAPSPSHTPRPPSTTPPPAPPRPPLSPPPHISSHLPPPHISSHPPAYHHERAPLYARDDGAPEPGPSKPRMPTSSPAHDPPTEEVWTPDEDELDVGIIPEGHVATDDKALLAARAARASAPAAHHTRASISARAAAPELDEEMEMAEFASRRRSLGIGGMDDEEELGEVVEASPSYARHTPAYPEPPRRISERASEKMRGEYAYAYGRSEGGTWEASAPPVEEMVASAPPDELEPSAPPAPSAPPGDDDFVPLPMPSAPPELDDLELEPSHMPLPPSPTDASPHSPH